MCRVTGSDHEPPVLFACQIRYLSGILLGGEYKGVWRGIFKTTYNMCSYLCLFIFGAVQTKYKQVKKNMTSLKIKVVDSGV